MSKISGWCFFSGDVIYSAEDAEVMAKTQMQGEKEEVAMFSDTNAMLYSSGGEIFEENGSAVLFDGEIYNKNKLIYELEHLGHKFSNKNDAEVVKKCYMQWGKGFATRLDGGFATVIYDKTENKIILARDKFGIKPLFFKKKNSGILFASEIKALLSLEDTTVGADGLCTLFGLWGTLAPTDTVFRGIESVGVAHIVMADSSGIRERLYWEPASEEHHETLSNTAEKVRYLVREAVSSRMGQRRGVLLLGDLGSAIVCAIGAGQYAFEMGERLDTYSYEYHEAKNPLKIGAYKSSSSKVWLNRLCDEFSTRHRAVINDATELFSVVEKAVSILDLPIAKKEDLLLLSGNMQISKRSSAVVTGFGADDLFGGRHWIKSTGAVEKNKFPWLLGYDSLVSYLNDDMAFYLNSEVIVAKKYADAIKKAPILKSENEFESKRRKLFHLTRTQYLPYILYKKNALFSACGINLVVPFCSGPLLEYVWNIPWNIKTPAGTDKGVLRLAMKGIVPDDINDRHKNNQGVIHTSELDKKIKKSATEIIGSTSEPISDFINIEKVEQAIKNNTISVDTLLFLLEFNIWLKQYGIVVK